MKMLHNNCTVGNWTKLCCWAETGLHWSLTSRSSCSACISSPAPGPGAHPSKHWFIPNYEMRPVKAFRSSLGGLWEQAGAERFVLRADYQRLFPDAVCQESRLFLPWVGWDKSLSHIVFISITSFLWIPDCHCQGQWHHPLSLYSSISH